MENLDPDDVTRRSRHEPDPSSSTPRRDDYERDYSRLIGSEAFRRLQGKSQIFGAGSGDFYRTRLTHTLEVAAIAREQARRLVNAREARLSDHKLPKMGLDIEEVMEHGSGRCGLRIDPIVVECAALAHDIGHPPFGHAGESDLDNLLKSNSEFDYRFEGNAQTLRLLEHLQRRPADATDERAKTESRVGLNLTKAVLLATNKYPRPLGTDATRSANSACGGGSLEPISGKGVYPSEWVRIEDFRYDFGIPAGCRTLECQLMDICDDIAYASHDLEDGIRAGKIVFAELQDAPSGFDHERWARNSIVDVVKQAIKEDKAEHRLAPGLFAMPDRKLDERISKAIDDLLKLWSECAMNMEEDAVYATSGLQKGLVRQYTRQLGILEDNVHGKPWFRITFVKPNSSEEDMETVEEMQILKRLAYETIVRDIRVQRLQRRGSRVIRGLWEVFAESRDRGERLIPRAWLHRYEQKRGVPGAWNRTVADYISQMTDFRAERMYAELFGTGPAGSIYERDEI